MVSKGLGDTKGVDGRIWDDSKADPVGDLKRAKETLGKATGQIEEWLTFKTGDIVSRIGDDEHKINSINISRELIEVECIKHDNSNVFEIGFKESNVPWRYSLVRRAEPMNLNNMVKVLSVIGIGIKVSAQISMWLNNTNSLIISARHKNIEERILISPQEIHGTTNHAQIVGRFIRMANSTFKHQLAASREIKNMHRGGDNGES